MVFVHKDEEERISITRLESGQRTTALDLAQALEGNEGTFLCQQGGQSFVAVARHGHSITSLKPVGIRYNVPSAVGGQEGWAVEKISNQEITIGEYEQQQRQTQAR